jgi:hypothetical protein
MVFARNVCLDWGLWWIQKVTSRAGIVTFPPPEMIRGRKSDSVPACSAGMTRKTSCLPGRFRRA